MKIIQADPQLAEEFLIGAWEFYHSDGIHGGFDDVRVFRREKGQLFLDHWEPQTLRKNVLVAWKKFSINRVTSLTTFPKEKVPTDDHFGIRLELDDMLLEIFRAETLPSGQQTLIFFMPHAYTAGWRCYRRVAKEHPAGTVFSLPTLNSPVIDGHRFNEVWDTW